jgi:putative hemolysin
MRERVGILAERPATVQLAAPAIQPRRTPEDATAVAEPVDPALLKSEIGSLPEESHLVAADMDVFVARADEIPHTLREIGRLREHTFRQVGEGTGRELDLDRFDETYLHLFVWNRDEREVVGAYRLGRVDRLLEAEGPRGLYTRTLFKYSPPFWEELGSALEMGRSFIRPKYQRSYAGLMLLWKGIGRFVSRHPRYTKLFGPVSISADYTDASQRLIVEFLKQNRFAHDWSRWVRPRKPFKPRALRGGRLRPEHLADLQDVSTFISEVESDGKGVPILLRQYLKLGGRLLGFNVDPDFSNVLDVMVVVDLLQTERKVLSRYMERDAAEAFLAFHRDAEPGLG